MPSKRDQTANAGFAGGFSEPHRVVLLRKVILGVLLCSGTMYLNTGTVVAHVGDDGDRSASSGDSVLYSPLISDNSAVPIDAHGLLPHEQCHHLQAHSRSAVATLDEHGLPLTAPRPQALEIPPITAYAPAIDEHGRSLADNIQAPSDRIQLTSKKDTTPTLPVEAHWLPETDYTLTHNTAKRQDRVSWRDSSAPDSAQFSGLGEHTLATGQIEGQYSPPLTLTSWPQHCAEELSNDAPPSSIELPEANPSASKPFATHLQADKVSADDDTITASGNVTVTIDHAELLCDTLTLDRRTGDVIANGDCLLYWNDNFVAAEWLTYKSNDKVFVIHQASGQGSDFSIGTADKSANEVVFWADKMIWRQDKTELHDATITTCDRPADDLHYQLESELVTVYPRDKIVAEQASLNIEGYHALTLGALTIPFNSQKLHKRSIVPTIGNNTTDGWFIRGTVPYTIDNGNYGFILVDYYTKTGFGLGAEHCYRLGHKGQGIAYYYRQGGDHLSNRYEMRNNVYYLFDDENEITWDFKANSSELPHQTPHRYITSNLNFKHQTERDKLLFSHNFSSSEASHSYHNWRLYYDVKLTPELTALLNADVSSTVTSQTTGNKFHYAAGLRHTSELFDSELMLENTMGTSYYHLNRNPELNLRSHRIYIGEVPIMATASFGNIAEYPSDVHTTRTEMTLQMPNQTLDYGTGKLMAGAGVRQVFYGTGHQMYTLAAQAGWIQNLGDVGTFRIDYNWLQPSGETPLQHDYLTGYSNLTGGLEFFDGENFNLAVTSGYNLRTHHFQNVTPRFSYKPNNDCKITLASSYDPNSAVWNSLDTGLKFKVTDNVSLSHWSVYDLHNKRFTYQDYQVNWEAHDWIASMIYRGIQKELYFQFSMKAFDTAPPELGPTMNDAILPRTLPKAFNL